MRKLDKIRGKQRFYMFSEKTKEKVLELNSFFGKYIMNFDDKIKKTFTYYDTPNHDLEKSNIVLFKTQINGETELNMATEKVQTNIRYTLRTNYKHYTKQIRPFDSLLKHKDWLIENFKSMFLSSLNFDAEFFMRKLQEAYTIKTVSREYRSANVTGLKITYSFDEDKYINHFNGVKAKGNILTIYLHSPESTDADYKDLMGKLERYLKELTPTTETKIMIARKMTAHEIVKTSKKKIEKPKDKKK